MELPTHGGLQLPGILEFAIPCLEFSQNTKNLEKTWSLVILGHKHMWKYICFTLKSVWKKTFTTLFTRLSVHRPAKWLVYLEKKPMGKRMKCYILQTVVEFCVGLEKMEKVKLYIPDNHNQIYWVKTVICLLP